MSLMRCGSRWVAAVVALALAASMLVPQAALAGGAPALGRLFLTPEQRRVLDEQREAAISNAPESPDADTPPGGLQPGRWVVLNGVIRRERGEPLVWINGQQVDSRTTAVGHVQLRNGPDVQNRVTVEAGAEGATARMKPGQAWNPATGKINDCIQCNAPQAAPKPAENTAAPAPTAATSAPAVTPAMGTANGAGNHPESP